MRHFLIKKRDGTLLEKRAVEGDDEKIDAEYRQSIENYPNLIITEVDRDTFEAEIVPLPLITPQSQWAEFKATNPTSQQVITYFAKVLGLE